MLAFWLGDRCNTDRCAFRSHRHRSTLASEIETHQETNKELRKQFSNKYRELADVRRESKKALSTAEQHKAEVQRWEGEHSRCQDELTAKTVELHEKQDELGRLKNELQVEKIDLESQRDLLMQHNHS